MLDPIVIFDDDGSMTYPGGKNGAGVYQTIINLMPPHDTYIEPFLGGGAVMRHKAPAKLNIGIDLDSGVIEDWKSFSIVKNDDARFRFGQGDGIGFLQLYPFTGRELVYCDPPYLFETRSSDRDLYEHELTDNQHIELLETLKNLPCMVMVSGYWSELYADHLTGWTATSYQSMTRGGTPATEWLWFNYAEPVALHDYQYLGTGFRDRQRIKRKKARWVDRLANMPLLERQALLGAISEAWPTAAASEMTMPAGIAENDDAPDPASSKTTMPI